MPVGPMKDMEEWLSMLHWVAGRLGELRASWPLASWLDCACPLGSSLSGAQAYRVGRKQRVDGCITLQCRHSPASHKADCKPQAQNAAVLAIGKGKSLAA